MSMMGELSAVLMTSTENQAKLCANKAEMQSKWQITVTLTTVNEFHLVFQTHPILFRSGPQSFSCITTIKFYLFTTQATVCK